MTDSDFTQKLAHDDVVAFLNSCSNTFGQLAAILKTIEKEAPEFSDLRKLAGAGHSIASDFENVADCWREEVKTNGVTAS
jgi:hypothetical protein